MKFRSCVTIACGLIMTALAFAQTPGIVKGVVKDTNGVPVPGAVIFVEGQANSGAVTDVDGNYLLKLPEKTGADSKLSVSCLGYQKETFPIGNNSVINFTIKEENEELEELVVVGYGSMRKSDLTGSVASVKIDESEAARSTSLDELLMGRAVGVEVITNDGSPDSGVNIKVRGMGSFTGSTEPLYVVDGIILNPPTEAGATLFENAGLDTDDTNDELNGLMGINPSDIASMEVLKDASATAIYGALGANGVVLITTKNAKKEKPTIQFSVGSSVSTPYKRMPVMSFDEYVDYRVSTGRSQLSDFYSDPETKTGLLVRPMDWQDYCISPAVSQRYNVAISGKPKTLSYYLSLGYDKKNGILKQTGSERLTTRMNLDKTFGKKVKIGTKSNFAYITSDLMQIAANGSLSSASSVMRSMLTSRPYARLNGDDEEGEDEEDDLELSATPMRWLENSQNFRKEIRITPSAYVTYTPLKWMSLKLTAGADYRDFVRTKFKGAKINSRATGSVGSIGSSQALRYNIDMVATFKNSFKGGHNITGTIGATMITSLNKDKVTEGWNIVQDGAKSENITGAVNSDFRYSETKVSSLSFFARAIYNYKERHILTCTFRADGSSKFLGANKWAYFPSFAYAWRLAQEPWFKIPVISNAKIRLGWGRVGNQSSPAYRTLATYSSVNYADHSADNLTGINIGIAPGYIPNPDLKWETTQQLNAGIDLEMWRGRLSMTVDVYNKNTFDLLQSRNISYASGFSSMYVNMGSINNKGIEFSINAVPVKTSDWEWTLDANISKNVNTVTSIGDDRGGDIFLSPDNYTYKHYFVGSAIGTSTAGYPLNVFIEGYPMGLFYGLKTDGIVQQGETGPGWTTANPTVGEGHIRYCDLNNDGIINELDRTIIGNPNPDFSFGFGTALTYKRWRFSARFSGTYGNDLFNVFNVTLTNTYSVVSTGNRLRDIIDYWTPENPNAKYPTDGRYDSSESKWISDRFVEDASYLKLSTLSAGYSFKFNKKSFIQGLSLTVSAKNLFILSKYSGWDPVSNTYGSQKMKMGADAGTYPESRSFSLDLKFNF